jgi:hypothetical protein
MSKVTFYGLPAWVGAIHGSTVTDWWSTDPAKNNWDRSLLHTIDLALTPSAALAGQIQISQIEADDFTASGGHTTIGPRWPGGTMIGGCWISDSYLTKHAVNLADRNGSFPGYDYEWTAVQYFDGEQQNRKFHGFHASVLQNQGALSLVEIWNPGSGMTPTSAGKWWIDLASASDSPAPPLNQPGPVFLDTMTIGHTTLIDPKIPPFRGGAAIPSARSNGSWRATASS